MPNHVSKIFKVHDLKNLWAPLGLFSYIKDREEGSGNAGKRDQRFLRVGKGRVQPFNPELRGEKSLRAEDMFPEAEI